MGIPRLWLLPFVLNNVAVSLSPSTRCSGLVCFAFFRGGRVPRQSRHSPLGPDESAAIAELERSLTSEGPHDAGGPDEALDFDRNLGASYCSVGGSRAGEDGLRRSGRRNRRARMLPDPSEPPLDVEERSQSTSYEGGGPPGTTVPTMSTVFDESLRAAESWESSSDRFRNPVGEVIDDISDDEMERLAREAERDESQAGPSLKQVLTSLQEPRPKAEEENNWRNFVQQFDIDADVRHCYGCGVRLQSVDASVKGFVDGAVLRGVREADERPRCQRCASMSSGRIFEDGAIAVGDSAAEAARETVSILRNALSVGAQRHVTVVYMMDALDMHFEDGLAELITSRRALRKGETHLYVVLNKVDLLPQHSRKRLLMYVHRFISSRAPALGLKPRHIFLMSSLKGNGVHLFLSVLLESAYRLRSRVFFVGATNAGKSTFINRLSGLVSRGDGEGAAKRKLLSTSVIPGTTLTPLRIETGPGFQLYDTPGLVVADSFTSHLTPSEIKMAVPASLGRITPFRLGAGYTLLLGPFARIDVLEGRPFFFTPYLSKHVQVVLKRTDRVASYLSRKPFGDVRLFYSAERQPAEGPAPGGVAAGIVRKEDREGAPTGPSMSAGGSTVVWPTDQAEQSSASAPGRGGPASVDTVLRAVNVIGEGWQRSTADLCFKGLGFVTLAGALELRLEVETLRCAGLFMREPLMPFDGIPFLRRKLPANHRPRQSDTKRHRA